MFRRMTTMMFIIMMFLPVYVGASGVSLKDAIDMALSTHPDVLKARAVVEELSAASEQLESGMGWRLDANLNGTYQKTPATMKLPYEVSGQEVPEEYGTYVTSLVVSRGLFWSPANAAKRDQAAMGVESAMAQLLMAQRDLFVKVVKAYYDAWKAADGVELARAARDDADRALKIALEKVKGGTGTESDATAARGSLLEAESNLGLAERRLDLALRLLANLVGRGPLRLEDLVRPVVDVSKFPIEPCPWSWGIDEMIRLAMKHRPEMRLAELGVSVAGRDVDAARAEGRPDISLSGSYSWGEAGVRLESTLKSDGRWSTILSRMDNTLPEVEEVEITDEEWERWNETWNELWEGEPPAWSPTKEVVEDILSGGAAVGTPEDAWDIKVGVTINIFDSHLVKRGIERAEKKVEQAKSQVELTAQMIEMDLLQCYSQLLDAHGGVKIAQIRVLEAEERQREAMGMKARGLLTPHEEKGLELLLLQRNNELKWALYDYEVAKAKLGVALGMELEWVTGVLNLL